MTVELRLRETDPFLFGVNHSRQSFLGPHGNVCFDLAVSEGVTTAQRDEEQPHANALRRFTKTKC